MNLLFPLPLWVACSLGFFFVIFASLTGAFSYFTRYIENDPLNPNFFSQYWLLFPLFERFFAVLFGFSLAFSANPLFIIFFILSVFWIVYDAFFNFFKNKNIYYISDEPVAFFDLFAHKYLKLFFLLSSLSLLLW